MNKKESLLLSGTFLLEGLSPEQIEALQVDAYAESAFCKRAERIDLSFKNERKIAFIISGECEVRKDGLILNNLKKGESFGILSVFSDEPYPTEIIAKKDCHILFLSKEGLLFFMEKNTKVALNLITFLAGRVTFLGGKIATLGGASVEDKLVAYLKNEYKSHGARLHFCASDVARRIRSGRASLYRALSALSAREIISYHDTDLEILDPTYFD